MTLRHTLLGAALAAALAVLAPTASLAQGKAFSFSHFLNLMRYGASGQTLADYRKDASKLGLNLIHHTEEQQEVYMVWGEDIAYQQLHMGETYTPQGPRPRCVNMDLTTNGRDRYSPITISLVFPDQKAQEQFWNEGVRLGCRRNNAIEDTDIDATWTNVRGLRYIANPQKQSSWRFIYFYEKDGLYLCTFLF